MERRRSGRRRRLRLNDFRPEQPAGLEEKKFTRDSSITHWKGSKRGRKGKEKERLEGRKRPRNQTLAGPDSEGFGREREGVPAPAVVAPGTAPASAMTPTVRLSVNCCIPGECRARVSAAASSRGSQDLADPCGVAIGPGSLDKRRPRPPVARQGEALPSDLSPVDLSAGRARDLSMGGLV